MRTANTMGLAVLFLGVMTFSAMAACPNSAPKKVNVAPRQSSHRNIQNHRPQRQCDRPQRRCNNNSSWALGLAFNVPSSNHSQPRPYIAAPQQPSTLSVGDTLYDVDGGGGATVSGGNNSCTGGDNPATPQPLANTSQYNPQWVETWRMGWAE